MPNVKITVEETLVKPVFEIINGKQYWTATSWVYKPDWESAGCSMKDDESGMWIVIVNLATLRKDHRESIPLFWVEHFGWQDATLQWLDFVFAHELLHWTCDGTSEENELIDKYVVDGRGEKMIRGRLGQKT